MCHEDCEGHRGKIEAGDLQWMTAGRGVLHCEMPWGDQECHGLQLWVNLPKKLKMVEPAYQELKDADIPRAKSSDGVEVKVIAGESMGVKSPVYTRTPTMYLDFKVSRGARFEQPIPAGWNVFAYVFEGQGWFGPKRVATSSHHTVVFENSKTTGGESKVEFGNDKSDVALRFVLVAGEPLNEPVVQHGPFVMNTREEIEQAFEDFQLGQNGFDKAPIWRSEGIDRSLIANR